MTASRASSKSKKKSKSAGSKIPPTTADAWKRVMMNKHVVLAISIGLVTNALFILLAIAAGVWGVVILVIILLLICGGVGLRVSWVLRQRDRHQHRDLSTLEHQPEHTVITRVPDPTYSLPSMPPSRPVSSLSQVVVDSATQTDTLPRKFQMPINVNANSLDDEQIMEYSDDDELLHEYGENSELSNEAQRVVSIRFATSAGNWLHNQAYLSIHSHIHTPCPQRTGLRSPSSWQMVRTTGSGRAFEEDSPTGSMIEVHREHDPTSYRNPIPIYTPQQVAAMYGLHGALMPSN